MALPYLMGGGFTTIDGLPLAHGIVTLALSAPATDKATGTIVICNGEICSYTLDATGNIAGTTQLVWPTDQMTPSNLYYVILVYTAEGQAAWGPNNQVLVAGANPFVSLSNITPGNPF